MFIYPLSLVINDFKVFGTASSKLSGAFKKPKQFLLCQAEALYLQSKQEGANPQIIEMADLFASKYLKDVHD